MSQRSAFGDLLRQAADVYETDEDQLRQLVGSQPATPPSVPAPVPSAPAPPLEADSGLSIPEIEVIHPVDAAPIGADGKPVFNREIMRSLMPTPLDIRGRNLGAPGHTTIVSVKSATGAIRYLPVLNVQPDYARVDAETQNPVDSLGNPLPPFLDVFSDGTSYLYVQVGDKTSAAFPFTVSA